MAILMDYNPNSQFNNSQNGGVNDGQNPNIYASGQMPDNSFRNGQAQNFYAPQYYPVMPVFVPDPEEEQRNKDRKILKSMGTAFGIAIIIYIVLSNASVLLLMFISKFFPAVGRLLNDTAGQFALEGYLSVFVLGGAFMIAYAILRSKKYVGILPYGTTYNKKASISLVMFLAPVVLISTIVINLISAILQDALGITFESGFEDMSADGPWSALILVITLAVIPAVVEEFCIRGVVLQPLRRYGDKFAILMSALIFSILHGNMVQIPYTLVAGIYFGYLCVATGSLWPSMVLHFINNMFSVIQVIVESNFGETASAVAVFVMLGALIVSGIIGGVIFFNMKYKAGLKDGVTTLKTGGKAGALFINPPMIIAIIFMLIFTASSISW